MLTDESTQISLVRMSPKRHGNWPWLLISQRFRIFGLWGANWWESCLIISGLNNLKCYHKNSIWCKHGRLNLDKQSWLQISLSLLGFLESMYINDFQLKNWTVDKFHIFCLLLRDKKFYFHTNKIFVVVANCVVVVVASIVSCTGTTNFKLHYADWHTGLLIEQHQQHHHHHRHDIPPRS